MGQFIHDIHYYHLLNHQSDLAIFAIAIIELSGIAFIVPIYLSHSVPVPSQVLHITVDEEMSEPFSRSRIERVFESDGTDKHINGVSTGLHYNGTLLLSTMFTGMMICDNK